MGLQLHRRRRNYKIIVVADTPVPTYAPDTLTVLFRQRVASWDLCAQRKVYTFVKELLCAWGHRRTLVLKVFFAQEVLASCIDWLRLLLFIGVVQNPGSIVAFAVSVLVYWVMLWLHLAVRCGLQENCGAVPPCCCCTVLYCVLVLNG
jgi:hypothetical protein